MTREEQIREASIDYQLSTNPRAIGGDAFADMAREMNVNPSFIAGAKWMEKQMIEKACEWLGKNIRNYINWEYNEFHQCVEYDGGMDIEKMISDMRKAMEE